MLRRYTDVIIPPFNTHRFRLKSQEKDRQKLLRSLEGVGHEEKMRIKEKVKAKEAKVAEEMESIKKEIYDGLIDEYTNKVCSIIFIIIISTDVAGYGRIIDTDHFPFL